MLPHAVIEAESLPGVPAGYYCTTVHPCGDRTGQARLACVISGSFGRCNVLVIKFGILLF